MYIGVFERSWLDIPPTFHPVTMRLNEFFRLEQNKVVEMQALCDIPQILMEADAWPMAPSRGQEWLVPGPATEDGIVPPPYDEEKSRVSQQQVEDMLSSLGKYSQGDHEAMNLPAFRHLKMTWYGPAGIGSNRRISGFRN